MKREEKSMLSRQKILDAAMEEFSRHGYDAASMNTICSENEISKGSIYHFFQDKDALYLLCAEKCFDALTDELLKTAKTLRGSAELRLRTYFDARLRFFSENRTYLGVFVNASFAPPRNLIPEIAKRRRKLDELNIAVLTELLKNAPLREDLSIDAVVQDFGMYMDYFNLHFQSELTLRESADEILFTHEERCHRQLNLLLYGAIRREHE